MRSRKPCVFARRRLFGWNVRLLTGTPGKQNGIDALPGRVQDMQKQADGRPVNERYAGRLPLVKPA
jgi:hypothetical protein